MSNPDRKAEIEEQRKRLMAEAGSVDVPDDAAAQTPDPQPPPATTEPPASAAEQAEPPKADEAPAPESVEKLKALVDQYKSRAEKRDKDLERGLHTTLAEKKKLEEEKRALEAEIAAIKAMKTAVTDVELDDDDDDLPEVTSRIKPVLGQVESLKRELEDLKRQQQETLKRREEEESMAFATRHFNTVREKHPDAALFLADDTSELRLAFLEWTQDKEPEYAEAATDALGKSPAFVARVLTEFKRDIGLDKKVESPLLGDLAVRAGAPARPSAPNPEDTAVFTEAQLGTMNLENEMFKLRGNREAQAAFMAKVRRSIAKHGG